MKTSLIVTTFNRPDALKMVLNSIFLQKVMPDEIIIADDGSGNSTKQMLAEFNNKKLGLKIIHSWQKNLGFRAARSRNRAIALSSGDYIILIDGDMILDRFFIEDHIVNSEIGCFIQGKRVLLSENLTKQAILSGGLKVNFFSSGFKNKKNMLRSKFLMKFASRKGFFSSGIKTCNMSFFRNDFISVNGFNNFFEGWGREDSEFVERLFNSGIKRKDLRFGAIQYHLYHNESSRDMLSVNDELLDFTISKKLKICKDGVNRFIK